MYEDYVSLICTLHMYPVMEPLQYGVCTLHSFDGNINSCAQHCLDGNMEHYALHCWDGNINSCTLHCWDGNINGCILHLRDGNTAGLAIWSVLGSKLDSILSWNAFQSSGHQRESKRNSGATPPVWKHAKCGCNPSPCDKHWMVVVQKTTKK